MYSKTKEIDFKALFENDRFATIQVKTLHYLVAEIYKVENDISPNFMKDIFTFQENNDCNLRRSGMYLV